MFLQVKLNEYLHSFCSPSFIEFHRNSGYSQGTPKMRATGLYSITIQTEMFIDQALSIYFLSPLFQAALSKASKGTTLNTMAPIFISQLVKGLVSWASSTHKSPPCPQFPSNAQSLPFSCFFHPRISGQYPPACMQTLAQLSSVSLGF